MSSAWKLIKDILFALLSYWREKQEQEEEAKQRQQEALQMRDWKITAEVEHERREVEERLEKAGRSADAYRDAFERLRRQQQCS
jgi:hypothetical protein